MVMHAAKYPRLEVGYTGHVEKPRGHRCDNNDRYGSEKSHNRLEPSYKGELEKSPRYPSKSRDTRSHKGERNRTNHVHSRNSEKTRSDKEPQFRSREEPEPEKRRDDQRRKIKDDSRRVAIRYCGDWTEQRSSTSNRIYYFNTATEESRWEKPPEWEESRAKAPDHPTSSMPHRRHNSQTSNRPYERPSSSASANHQKSWHESSRDTRHSSTRPADYHRPSNGPRRPVDDRHVSSSRRDSSSKDARHNHERSGSITSSGTRKDRREEASRCQAMDVNKDLGEDMEISPTSSPCSSTHSSPSVKGKQNSKAMVEVVLKSLQEALTKKSIIGKKISPTEGGSNGRIPTVNNDEDPDDDYESPEDGSDQDSRTSSVPPETPEDMNIADKLNSQLPPSTGSLSKLKPRSRDTVPTLPPSLADYYDESLIGHVKNWSSELAETETWRLGGELLHLKASNSQVSVDLKRYRSAVRLANVQATLKEQRIIFLQKLQKDIEESKPARHFQDDCVS